MLKQTTRSSLPSLPPASPSPLLPPPSPFPALLSAGLSHPLKSPIIKDAAVALTFQLFPINSDELMLLKFLEAVLLRDRGGAWKMLFSAGRMTHRPLSGTNVSG